MGTRRETRIGIFASCVALSGACGEQALDFRSAGAVPIDGIDEVDEVDEIAETTLGDTWVPDAGVVEETTWGGDGTTTWDPIGEDSSTDTSSSSGETWPGTWSDGGTSASDGDTSASDGDTSDGGTSEGGSDETGEPPPECTDYTTTWHCSSEPDVPCECEDPVSNPNPDEYYEPDPPPDDSCGEDEEPSEMQLGPLAEPAKTAEILVKYSRGNNDRGELNDQFKAAGVYQYQTAALDISVKADRTGCTCTEGKVAGDMLLEVKFTAAGIKPEDYRDAMLNNYFMICGEAPPKATTQVGAMKDPGPNLKTYGLKTNIGKLTDGVKFTGKDGTYSAEVTCKMTCETGDLLNRVYLPPQAVAGKQGVIFDPPNAKNLVPTAYIDTKVTVAKDGAITLEPRYVEYIAGYKWLEATKPELPTVDVVWNTGGGMEKSEKTWLIAKLIHDGTKKVGEPFLPDKT